MKTVLELKDLTGTSGNSEVVECLLRGMASSEKSIIVIGGQGTGKTTVANAIYKEANDYRKMLINELTRDLDIMLLHICLKEIDTKVIATHYAKSAEDFIKAYDNSIKVLNVCESDIEPFRGYIIKMGFDYINTGKRIIESIASVEGNNVKVFLEYDAESDKYIITNV